jgi:integrase/recombinase XerD
LKASAVNAYIQAVNAYLHWCANPDIKHNPFCRHARIQKLREPVAILPVYTAVQISTLLKFRPSGFIDRRLHLLVCMLLDTGCRISEVLGIRVENCDVDNLLLIVTGKGDKQRRIPMSIELRKLIVRFVHDFDLTPLTPVLCTRRGKRLDVPTCRRDVKNLCSRLGFTAPPRVLHSFRHTFAVNYLKRGGSVFHLQKMLGHSTLTMTRRYANLSVQDLSDVHQRLSLLAA